MLAIINTELIEPYSLTLTLKLILIPMLLVLDLIVNNVLTLVVFPDATVNAIDNKCIDTMRLLYLKITA